MPRIRSIKPEFPADEKLARVSRDARLTFVNLLTQADDYGLLPGSMRELLAAAFPLDDGEHGQPEVTAQLLAAWLEELRVQGVIRWRVTRDGARVLEFPKWADHQKVDKPGRPILREKLAPLSRNPREESAAPSMALPPAEVGSRKGKEEREGGEGAVAAATALEVSLAMDPHDPADPAVAAYRHYRGKARSAVALDAQLQMLHNGAHGSNGRAVPWPVIGRALHEMHVVDATCSPAVLRAFVKKLAEDPGARVKDTTPLAHGAF